MLDKIQKWLLEQELGHIDGRLDVIERALALNPPETKAQVLREEQYRLSDLRIVTARKLQEATQKSSITDLAAERRKRILVKQRALEIEDNALQFAAKLDREGDPRQASIWREQAIKAHTLAARELGLDR